MSKEEYLDELDKNLGKLSGTERLNAMQYYSEYIDEIVANGEDIEEKLGAPKDVAYNIMGDVGVETMNNPETKPKEKLHGWWIVLLAIFALPIGLPLLIVVFALCIAVSATLFGLIIGFGAAFISCAACGVIGIIGGIIIMFISPITGLSAFGTGILAVGLGILFYLFVLLLCKAFIKFFSWLFTKLSKKKKDA